MNPEPAMLAGTPETKIRTVGHRRPLRICGIAINTLVILGKILLLRDLLKSFQEQQLAR